MPKIIKIWLTHYLHILCDLELLSSFTCDRWKSNLTDLNIILIKEIRIAILGQVQILKGLTKVDQGIDPVPQAPTTYKYLSPIN